MRYLWLLAFACTHATPASAPSPIPLATARAYFAEAHALCSADRTWGRSLCGPIMFVDPDTRLVVADHAAAALHARDGVFVGTLEAGATIANTATTWRGTSWVQLRWPLPVDRGARAVLLMHESFHRIAPALGIAGAEGCAHLDREAERIALQREWRALAAGLQATDEPARRSAIRDALALRRTRDAADCEDALERHEGLAEYTGVRAGLPPQDLVAGALHDLTEGPQAPSFMRSFAYASGPALGLLLDRYAPAWRASVAHASLAGLLAQAVGVSASVDPAAYDGDAIRTAEAQRSHVRAAQLAHYRARLVDGPLAILPLIHMQIAFDPRTVIPLDGNVYPTLRVVDRWGVLDVTGGARILADWSAVVVPATGEGWTLQRAPGWHFVPDAGDLRLSPP